MTTRDVGDISTHPGGKTGEEWTEDARASILALWGLTGGLLTNVAGTNAITADPFVATGFTAYSDGMEVWWIPVSTNTDACTLDLGGIGDKSLVDQDGAALDANAVIAGRLTGARFVAANDHFRLIAASGTTNVTVQGGIILQRRTPSRLIVGIASTADPTIVTSQSFQAGYFESRVIIEGAVSYLVGAGGNDADGFVIDLLVDGVSVETISDYLISGQKQNTPFAFEYEPGDVDSHVYAIQVTPTIACEYVASSTFIVCSELSSNP